MWLDVPARFEDPYKERYFCWLVPDGVLYICALSAGYGACNFTSDKL